LGNAAANGPVAVLLTKVNATTLTTDPVVGQLYQIYTQAMAALQLKTTALTMVPPDTAVKPFQSGKRREERGERRVLPLGELSHTFDSKNPTQTLN
jgi:hypothetical protein